MAQQFANRTEAGQHLAKRLLHYANRVDVIVLALPRGGVPVGFEIAQILHVPLDICLVRKLGAPHNKELAMGAIAVGGVKVINQDIVDRFNISQKHLAQTIAQEQKELNSRAQLYQRSNGEEARVFTSCRNQTVILVDDGIATGATLQAALTILKQQQPAQLVVATPVAPPSVNTLFPEADEVICGMTPDPLYSIGCWYQDFSQVPDEDVCRLLARSSLPL